VRDNGDDPKLHHGGHLRDRTRKSAWRRSPTRPMPARRSGSAAASNRATASCATGRTTRS